MRGETPSPLIAKALSWAALLLVVGALVQRPPTDVIRAFRAQRRNEGPDPSTGAVSPDMLELRQQLAETNRKVVALRRASLNPRTPGGDHGAVSHAPRPPPPPPPPPTRSRCAVELDKLLARSQAPTNKRTAVVDLSHPNIFGDGLPLPGFGSLVNHYAIPALIMAAASGERLTFASNSTWHYGCSGKPHAADIIAVDGQPQPSAADEELGFLLMHNVARGFELRRRHLNRLQLAWRNLKLNLTASVAEIPECPAELTYFDMVSAAARRLVRPAPGIAAVVRAQVVGIGLPARYNAVHIRAGDKLVNESKDLKDMTANPKWWSEFIMKSFGGDGLPVFIASDDCELLLKVREWLGQTQSVDVFHRCPLTGGGAAGHDAATWNSKQQPCDSVYAVLSDIEVLADSIKLAGSLRSNLPRLVVKLRGTLDGFTAVPKTEWALF